MSDDKDPVREQIERDAKVWSYLTVVDGVAVTSRNDGAVLEYINIALTQDKIAWNRCIEAVKDMASKQQDEELDENGYSALERLKKELEKLRR